MQNLYHIRMENRLQDSRADINVLVTATDEAAARTKGLDCVNPAYVQDYEVRRCEVVCQTADTVDYYEPV